LLQVSFLHKSTQIVEGGEDWLGGEGNRQMLQTRRKHCKEIKEGEIGLALAIKVGIDGD